MPVPKSASRAEKASKKGLKLPTESGAGNAEMCESAQDKRIVTHLWDRSRVRQDIRHCVKAVNNHAKPPSPSHDLAGVKEFTTPKRILVSAFPRLLLCADPVGISIAERAANARRKRFGRTIRSGTAAALVLAWREPENLRTTGQNPWLGVAGCRNSKLARHLLDCLESSVR
jgi:hypothetical protein